MQWFTIFGLLVVNFDNNPNLLFSPAYQTLSLPHQAMIREESRQISGLPVTPTMLDSWLRGAAHTTLSGMFADAGRVRWPPVPVCPPRLPRSSSASPPISNQFARLTLSLLLVHTTHVRPCRPAVASSGPCSTAAAASNIQPCRHRYQAIKNDFIATIWVGSACSGLGGCQT